MLTSETSVVPSRGCPTETDINRPRLELPILGAQANAGCDKTSEKEMCLSRTNLFVLSLDAFQLPLPVMSLFDARIAGVRDYSSGRTWVIVTSKSYLHRNLIQQNQPVISWFT